MNESKPENNPWSTVAEQSIRLPERPSRKLAVRKILGFVLMGFGGLALAVFALYAIAILYAVRHAIRHPGSTDVPAVTPFDVTVTVASGMVGIVLIAAGYWLFRGSLFLRNRLPS